MFELNEISRGITSSTLGVLIAELESGINEKYSSCDAQAEHES